MNTQGITSKRVEPVYHAYRAAMSAMHEQRMGGEGSIEDVTRQVRTMTHLSPSGQAEELHKRFAAIDAANRSRARSFTSTHKRLLVRIQAEYDAAIAAREAATDPARVTLYREEYRTIIGDENNADARTRRVEQELENAVRLGDVNRVRALRIEGPNIIDDRLRATKFLELGWDALLPPSAIEGPADIAKLQELHTGLQSDAFELEEVLTDGIMRGGYIAASNREPSPMRETIGDGTITGKTLDESAREKRLRTKTLQELRIELATA